MVNDFWISLIIGTFVSYFVATTISLELGPFEICINFRTWIHNRFGQNHWIARGVNCPKCVGFYTSLVVAIALILVLHWSWWSLPWLWLGMAGAVRFIYVWGGQ